MLLCTVASFHSFSPVHPPLLPTLRCAFGLHWTNRRIRNASYCPRLTLQQIKLHLKSKIRLFFAVGPRLLVTAARMLLRATIRASSIPFDSKFVSFVPVYVSAVALLATE